MSNVVRNPSLQTMYAVPSKTGISIVEEIPFNEWRSLFETVKLMGASASWWIGDVLAFGERFRHDYREALEQIDRADESLRVYAWVAGRVPRELRVAELSWTHHRVVAALEPGEQGRWLSDALRLGWTSRELDEAIREERPLPRVTTPALTVRATGELYDRWTAEAKRVGADPPDWAARGLDWLIEHGSPHLDTLEAA